MYAVCPLVNSSSFSSPASLILCPKARITGAQRLVVRQSTSLHFTRGWCMQTACKPFANGPSILVFSSLRTKGSRDVRKHDANGTPARSEQVYIHIFMSICVWIQMYIKREAARERERERRSFYEFHEAVRAQRGETCEGNHSVISGALCSRSDIAV